LHVATLLLFLLLAVVELIDSEVRSVVVAGRQSAQEVWLTFREISSEVRRVQVAGMFRYG
jgi:hypothetical protein